MDTGKIPKANRFDGFIAKSFYLAELAGLKHAVELF